MSSTRIDETSSSSSSGSSNSVSRRSSLVVNLSTIKKRSSVTRLLTSSGASGAGSTSTRSCTSDSSSSSSSGAFSTSHQQSGGDRRDVLGSCPQSAPPSLIKPSYRVTTTLVRKITSPVVLRELSSSHKTNEQLPQTTTNNLQVLELRKEGDTTAAATCSIVEEEDKLTSFANRQDSKEDSPVPIVEVRHTSSSSSGGGSDSAHSSDNNISNSKSRERRDLSTKLVRRKTVRRYHRSTNDWDGSASDGNGKRLVSSELTISIRNPKSSQQQNTTTTSTLTSQSRETSPDKHLSYSNQQQVDDNLSERTQFRTRQLGSYSAHQQQQQQQAASKDTHLTSKHTSSHVSSSTSSSKIAKCITTTSSSNSSSSSRKSTTHLISSSQSKGATDISQVKPIEESEMLSTKRDLKESLIRPASALDCTVLVEADKLGPGALRYGADRIICDKSSSRRSIAVQEEEEESSIRHSRFSSSSLAAAAATSNRIQEASSAQVSSSSIAAAQRNLSSQHHLSTDLTSSSSHFKHSSLSSSQASALFVSKAGNQSGTSAIPADFQVDADAIFSSPDVRSLVKEIGIDFAELENFAALSSSSTSYLPGASGRAASLSSRLFPGRRPLSPLGSGNQLRASLSNGDQTVQRLDSFTTDYQLSQRESYEPSVMSQKQRSNGERISELLSRAQNHAGEQDRSSLADPGTLALPPAEPASEVSQHKTHCKAVMSESIERIDQRMSDLCKKFHELQDSREAIDLLKVMIQTIEKAWSVPVCGDDLGFKLCNSLREAGGLDIILGFIQDADEQSELDCHSQERWMSGDEQVLDAPAAPGSPSPAQAKSWKRPLKLNLSKLGNNPARASLEGSPLSSPQVQRAGRTEQQNEFSTCATGTGLIKDSDSENLTTSDLGLDSTSIESLSYVVSAQSTPKAEATPTETDVAAEKGPCSPEQVVHPSTCKEDELGEAHLMKEELVFLSARLLSQCLTSENRNYIVANGLESIIKLACKFTTMKSTQSHRFLARSLIMRQSSNSELLRRGSRSSQVSAMPKSKPKPQSEPAQQQGGGAGACPAGEQPAGEHSEVHAVVGTEILQHLFKHSEVTCSKMISLGGLEAILYGCRSSNVDTLRHCASALANLALYGGPDSQQMMIEEKAHVWLFPLAFNEDDNIQYYACLAIVVLAANQEIEGDVLKSSTLNLVEPFVTSHEPQKFAESTTAHIHGQSASWLRKLAPLIESKREEARNLACFHFAMEAHIKREQGQTHLFADIGALEPLRRVGGSPMSAIAAKFACQALRLVGELEPRRLSQQVPLWSSEDVAEWVCQVGFERFRAAFLESRVDGDLLLQLDEEALRADLGLENGIVRRRFLRELGALKRVADYSSADRTRLSALLLGAAPDFVPYLYAMLQLGVTRDNIHLVDAEQLLRECKVANPIGRAKLAHALKGIQERLLTEAAASSELAEAAAAAGGLGAQGGAQKSLDVFVSYRRSTGSQLASLLKVHLQLRGFSVFIDVERLEAGKFDNNLLDSIKAARNFVLVLSPSALDRCINDHQCKDWVHKEIVAALAANCNIIPIMDNFHWPDAELLPEDMRSISNFNGVRWIHDYQEACVEKIERFIRGEISNGQQQQQLPQSQSQIPASAQTYLAAAQASSHYSSSAPSPSLLTNGTPSGACAYPSSAYSSSGASDYHPLSAAFAAPTQYGSPQLASIASSNHLRRS